MLLKVLPGVNFDSKFRVFFFFTSASYTLILLSDNELNFVLPYPDRCEKYYHVAFDEMIKGCFSDLYPRSI